MAKKVVDEIKDVLKGRKKKKESKGSDVLPDLPFVQEGRTSHSMANKKTDSKVYDYSETYGAIDMVKQGAYEEIAKLNSRIDKIILAHESCKTLKGL